MPAKLVPGKHGLLFWGAIVRWEKRNTLKKDEQYKDTTRHTWILTPRDKFKFSVLETAQLLLQGRDLETWWNLSERVIHWSRWEWSSSFLSQTLFWCSESLILRYRKTHWLDSIDDHWSQKLACLIVWILFSDGRDLVEEAMTKVKYRVASCSPRNPTLKTNLALVARGVITKAYLRVQHSSILFLRMFFLRSRSL